MVAEIWITKSNENNESEIWMDAVISGGILDT